MTPGASLLNPSPQSFPPHSLNPPNLSIQKMPNVLIIGATRGLGASLANVYASHANTTVYGTTRSAEGPKTGLDEKIKWVKGIDLIEKDAGRKLVGELKALGVEGGFSTVVS
jgi:NAD(P)-dependent dehydrogenase (short-subunit alcohol dehydrogenase family)